MRTARVTTKRKTKAAQKTKRTVNRKSADQALAAARKLFGDGGEFTAPKLRTGLTRHQAQKALRKLEGEGFVRRTRFVGGNEPGKCGSFFVLTEKGRGLSVVTGDGVDALTNREPARDVAPEVASEASDLDDHDEGAPSEQTVATDSEE